MSAGKISARRVWRLASSPRRDDSAYEPSVSAGCRRNKHRFAGHFLPAAGNVWDGELNNVGSNGNYWSSTPNDENNAYNLNFNSGNANWNNNNRNNGQSVRPVRSTYHFFIYGQCILSFF